MMEITFTAKPIETAPKDREIMLWLPRRRKWAKGRWDSQTTHQKPRPLFWTYGSQTTDDRSDQPTHWAEVEEMEVPQ